MRGSSRKTRLSFIPAFCPAKSAVEGCERCRAASSGTVPELQPEKQSPTWRRYLPLVLRLACAVLLLAWVWKKLALQGASGFSLADIQLKWLALAVALGGFSVLAWAGRWWWFLRVYGLQARYRELLRLTLFADFFNLYFLGPLGADGIRLLLLSRTFPARRGAIVGSLVLDHAGGLFGGMALYFLFVGQTSLPDTLIRPASTALLAFAAVSFLGLGVIMEPWLQRLLARIPGLRWLSARADPVYAGPFRHPWLFSGFAVSSLGTACAYGAYWAAARALGADLRLPEMLGLMPVVDAIASLPFTLSGIGIREGLLVEWLGGRENIGAAKALAVSLLGFASLGVWGLAGGLWLAFWRRTKVGQFGPN